MLHCVFGETRIWDLQTRVKVFYHRNNQIIIVVSHYTFISFFYLFLKKIVIAKPFSFF